MRPSWFTLREGLKSNNERWIPHLNFIQRRVLIYVVILLVVINVDFFLPRAAPGNAAEAMVTGSSNPALQIAIKEARFGLNQPLYMQYFLYLKGIFATWPPNLGVSFQYYPRSVDALIATRLPWTLFLIFVSIFFSVIITYFMARYSSLRTGGKGDKGLLYSSISLQTVPIYWVAMIFLWGFGFEFKLFPSFGNVTPGLSNVWAYLGSATYHSVLPIVVMTLSLLGSNYLLLRGSVQDAIKSDYVTAAKTRGLKDRIIASAYILRNSLLPFVAVMSFSMASLVSRDVLIEAVFGYNGVGDLLVDGVVNRDYPVLEGTLFVLTVLIVVGGLIGDFVLLRLDPRLRR